MSKKMGRPPKKAKDKHSRPVSMRLTPSQHKKLIVDARAAGLSISAYLIDCWQKVKGGDFYGKHSI
jgi:predicted HicB family RNase H-like nuclease